MKSSDSTAAISEALVLLLAGLKNPPKTKKGGGGQKTYKYAELPDILDAVRPELAKCLLSLTMEAVTDGPTVGVAARILHASGEWIEYGPLMLPAGNDAQSAGSALSYARRYLVCAILNIAADEDDDGQRAAAPNGGGSTGRTGRAAAKRPESADGEAAGSGPTSATGGDSSTEGTGDSAAVPPVPEPHEHVPGKQLASGKVLCIYEFGDGSVCGEPFRPAPTVFTEPVQERADIK